MEIEMTNGGKFIVELSKDAFETVAASASRPNPNGGWHTFHFRSGGEFGAGIERGDYFIRIRGLPGWLQIRGGTLYYDT